MAWKGGVNSAVTIFSYTLHRWHRAAGGRSRVRDGIRNEPERQPDDPDARRDDLVHGRWDRSADVQLAEAVHSAAVARVDDDGHGLRDGRWIDSLIVDFTYTKTGPVCPELTSGNFGWIDYSGGSNSNADLKDEIEHPENRRHQLVLPTSAPVRPTRTAAIRTTWPMPPTTTGWSRVRPGHRDIVAPRRSATCTSARSSTSRSGTTSSCCRRRSPTATTRCSTSSASRPSGSTASSTTRTAAIPTNDACGDGLDLGGKPNDKGFVGTYVDSFVGTQVAPCIPSPDGTNPCQNLQNDRLEINLAD